MEKCPSLRVIFLRILFTAAFIQQSRPSLISKSAIVDCVGSSSDALPRGSSAGVGTCKKMLLVSMTVKGNAGPGESIYANVDRAYREGDDKMSKMKKPFRLEISKSNVIASYRVLYKKSVNAMPEEKIITTKHCQDLYGLKPERLPCRYQLDSNGKRVFDSQGFCCVCSTIGFAKRSNLRCDPIAIIAKYGTAHCMVNHDLWYEVFRIQDPMLQYNISIHMYEFSGMAVDPKTKTKFVNWTSVSNFTLNPSQSMGRSKDGRVIAEVQGNLLGDRTVQDFSYKYLLIPSIGTWPSDKAHPVQYTNGPNDWMLIDKHEFELRGDVCNKIGVSYAGFRYQTSKCMLPANTCLMNQPLHYWTKDNEKRKAGETGSYFLGNFGEVDKSTHPNNNSFILRFRYKHFHNTMLTFKIDASDISFVQNIGSGRIVSAEASDLMALKTKGKITAVIENTGEVSAEFSVSVLKCTYGVHQVPAEAAVINPGQTVTMHFSVMAFVTVDEGTKSFMCEVQLFDSAYNLLQTARVNFLVETTCYCTPSCGCSCNPNETIRCPEAPVRYVPGGSIAVRLLLLTLESIGVEGFVGFFGAILVLLGCFKLSFGSILCCRKTKAQEHAEKAREKGGRQRGPILVRCSGECRGARAAQAKYKRKLERLKRMGKKGHMLDDWTNYSYECTCHAELTDIQFYHVIRAVCFFYYSCLLPFIWLGKKIHWTYFKDTAEQKHKAEQAVLKTAQQKGKMEKYGAIDLEAELRKLEQGDDKISPQKKADAASGRRRVPATKVRGGKPAEDFDLEPVTTFECRASSTSELLGGGDSQCEHWEERPTPCEDSESLIRGRTPRNAEVDTGESTNNSKETSSRSKKKRVKWTPKGAGL